MSRVTTQIEEAKRLHQEAIERMDEQDVKIQALPEDLPKEEREFHAGLFEKYAEDAQRRAETLERLVAIQNARGLAPADTNDSNAADIPSSGHRTVGQVVSEPRTYRAAGQGGNQSFFRDLVDTYVNQGAESRERLTRHMREMVVEGEVRDISTSSTAGGGFVPPVYMGEYYAAYARESRPFADIVPTSPLVASGMTLTIPRITTGPTVTHIITENSTAPAETNLVDSNLSVPVVTIAGMQDVSQALFERSDPSIDQIVFNDLRADYDRYLDTQMLSGTGANGQHLGIRAVSSPNTVTYTQATPTAALTTPKLYDAIQQIASNRHAPAEAIIMHPRRSAWLASNLSSTFPLFQVGGLNQAAGQQDIGSLVTISGLRVVSDSNVGILYGASTTEDEIYVVRASDMHLWEGPLSARVMPEVGSGTLTVRLILHGFSAFASARYAKSITIVSGTGLISPSF